MGPGTTTRQPPLRRRRSTTFHSAPNYSTTGPHLDRAQLLLDRPHHSGRRQPNTSSSCCGLGALDSRRTRSNYTASMCVYHYPELDLIVNAPTVWTSPLLPTSDKLADRYLLVTGLPLAHWKCYMALGYFKLAIMAAGIDLQTYVRTGTGKDETFNDRKLEVVATLISLELATLHHAEHVVNGFSTHLITDEPPRSAF